MREKSDASKLREGRGLIIGSSYEAWRRANEAKSSGTASLIYDPISGRSVSVLSSGEERVFWKLRWSPNVDEIYEQYPMNKALTDQICKDYKLPRYNHILSTDFLVQKTDGSYVAISVKSSRKEFDQTKRRYDSLVRRQTVEKLYWENMSVPFWILFADEIDNTETRNIKAIMKYWPAYYCVDRIGRLKHLIAHRVIDVSMDKPIRYGDLAREIDVDRLFAKLVKEKTHESG